VIARKAHWSNSPLITVDSDFYKTSVKAMPASVDPDSTAQDYIRYLFGGKMPTNRKRLKNSLDCWLVKVPDRKTTIIYRSTQQRKHQDIATVEIHGFSMRPTNGKRSVTIKFPKL